MGSGSFLKVVAKNFDVLAGYERNALTKSYLVLVGNPLKVVIFWRILLVISVDLLLVFRFIAFEAPVSISLCKFPSSAYCFALCFCFAKIGFFLK